jgi:hypothetical protein
VDEAEGDHGIPRGEAALIQQCSQTRVWWGDSDYLDPFLVLEALRHGCLPLQCVSQASHDALVASLPPGLSRFTLPIPEVAIIPAMSAQERAERIDAGLSVLLSGNLERDLVERGLPTRRITRFSNRSSEFESEGQALSPKRRRRDASQGDGFPGKNARERSIA